MNKFISDRVFGIILILLGFGVGYGIWYFGSEMLFMRSAVKSRADVVFLFAFIPAVLIFLLWYNKQLRRAPVERQFGTLNQPIQIILVAFVTTVGLVGASFLLGFQPALAYAVIISALVTIFSGISFYKFRPY